MDIVDNNSSCMKKIKAKEGLVVLSLFDGMSCGQLALEKVGIKVDKYYASEIKTYGIEVTQDNFPNTIQIGDVTKVSYKDGVLSTENGSFDVGKIDLIIGGSPCQNFSRAMTKENRLGLKGEKSKLFFEYLRILEEVKPEKFLLENVKMDKNSNKELDEYMGVTSWNFNSEKISAGLRNRNYWTNIKFERNVQRLDVKVNDILEYGYVPYDKSPCLLESHSRPPKDKLRLTRRYFEKKFIPIVFESEEHYKEVLEHYDLNYRGLSAKEVDNKRDNIDNEIYNKVRVFSALEMERIQGVPDGYTKSIDRNKAASLLGDGWSVDAISHILEGLKK